MEGFGRSAIRVVDPRTNEEIKLPKAPSPNRWGNPRGMAIPEKVSLREPMFKPPTKSAVRIVSPKTKTELTFPKVSRIGKSESQVIETEPLFKSPKRTAVKIMHPTTKEEVTLSNNANSVSKDSGNNVFPGMSKFSMKPRKSAAIKIVNPKTR